MTAVEIEAVCRAWYGKTWDGPLDKMPGPKMKDVWRDLARRAVVAIDQVRIHGQRRERDMSNNLFDGSVIQRHRIAHVSRMMGYAPDATAPQDYIERLLSKAEDVAYEYLVREIGECMSGEAARRISHL